MNLSLIMKPNERHDPAAPASAPLTDLVEDKLNKPLAERIAEEIEKDKDEPARSGVADYARGTAEHDDDRET